MNTTIIIVSYNTSQLLQDAHYSIRKYYPETPVIIVDNSDRHDQCYKTASYLKSDYTRVLHTNSNVGHGPAMKFGIAQVNTEYFLLMDSDVTINCSGVIERMEDLFSENTYGVGQVMQINSVGLNVDTGIPYLHPHFALISKEQYIKHEGIINHGAPMIKAMQSVEISGAELIDVAFGDNITHKERGTRELNPVKFNPKYWDRV